MNTQVAIAVGVDLMLAVNKDSQKQDAVMKFIQFMRMGDGQQWSSEAIGLGKLKYTELEKALVVALQNVAAGADAKTELQAVQKISASIKR